MIIGRGNRNTRTKPATVTFCSPQIPRDLAWGGTQAAPSGSRQLTVRAMVRPPSYSDVCIIMWQREQYS
jgi:hypothetical protein